MYTQLARQDSPDRLQDPKSITGTGYQDRSESTLQPARRCCSCKNTTRHLRPCVLMPAGAVRLMACRGRILRRPWSQLQLHAQIISKLVPSIAQRRRCLTSRQRGRAAPCIVNSHRAASMTQRSAMLSVAATLARACLSARPCRSRTCRGNKAQKIKDL